MDTAFFVVSKLVGLMLRVETWLVILLILSVLTALRGRARWSGGFGAVALVLVCAMAALPIGGWLLAPMEAEHPIAPELGQVDGIVILGGMDDFAATRRWQHLQLNDAAERYADGFVLARRHPEANVVITGGYVAQGRGLPRDTTQDPRWGFLTQQGIAADRIFLENQSRNTVENARLSYEMMTPQPGQTWVLVTSAFHMTRAMRSFDAAGWPEMVPYPVDFRSDHGGRRWDLGSNLLNVNMALKERVGRVVYALTNR